MFILCIMRIHGLIVVTWRQFDGKFLQCARVKVLRSRPWRSVEGVCWCGRCMRQRAVMTCWRGPCLDAPTSRAWPSVAACSVAPWSRELGRSTARAAGRWRTEHWTLYLPVDLYHTLPTATVRPPSCTQLYISVRSVNWTRTCVLHSLHNNISSGYCFTSHRISCTVSF